MKFFPIELGSPAVVFLLNIFCLTVVLVEECLLNVRYSSDDRMSEYVLHWHFHQLALLCERKEERFRSDNGKARGTLPKLKPSPGCVQIRRTNKREMNAQATMSSWTIDAHEHSVGHGCPRRILRFAIEARLKRCIVGKSTRPFTAHRPCWQALFSIVWRSYQCQISSVLPSLETRIESVRCFRLQRNAGLTLITFEYCYLKLNANKPTEWGMNQRMTTTNVRMIEKDYSFVS